MTNDDLIRLLINSFVISWTALAAGCLVGASFYDARQLRFKTLVDRNPNSRRLRPRPTISIIVAFRDHEDSIVDCINSVLKGKYRKYELLMVDAGSSDSTTKTVGNFISANPKKAIKIIGSKPSMSLPAAIAAAAHQAKGDLIMVLDPGSKLDKLALKNAVLRLNWSGVDAVGLNVKILPNDTLLGLFERFEYLARHQARKLNSLLHISRGFENGVIYRREALDSGQNSIKYRFAADGLIYKLPSASYAEAVTRQKQQPETKGLIQVVSRVYLSAMRILAPFLFIFFIYQAFYFRQVFLFGLTWISLIVFLSLTVLAEEKSGFKSKLRLVALTPMMYLPVFLSSLLVPIVAFKNLLVLAGRAVKSKLRLPGFLTANKEEKIA